MLKLLAGFLRVIRLPNLVFMALAQSLLQFCVYHRLYEDTIPAGDGWRFALLALASFFIAAAGYIINDYFDINMDEINKPDKIVVGRIMKRRWAIVWHFVFSAAGVLLTMLAVQLSKQWYLALANLFCVGLLWLYSTWFKKRLLIGNIVIAVLTAWSILIVFFSKFSLADAVGMGQAAHDKFFRITMLYAGFAFILTLIREAVKDIEDMPGDEKFGCRTMPILWGVNATKVYIAVWMVALLALLIILQVYVLQFRWWWPVLYCILLIIVPLLYLFSQLFRAVATNDFHRLSTGIKLVMLTGILSMVFFYFYL